MQLICNEIHRKVQSFSRRNAVQGHTCSHQRNQLESLFWYLHCKHFRSPAMESRYWYVSTLAWKVTNINIICWRHYNAKGLKNRIIHFYTFMAVRYTESQIISYHAQLSLKPHMNTCRSSPCIGYINNTKYVQFSFQSGCQ